ncbi:MAG TPA: sugar phosphate isomerase/epimerase family protein, partial [Chloroflexota bacterium]|nr:sugar phosphate isomerase/epimerase family protein [Chloroflexota bacterium]
GPALSGDTVADSRERVLPALEAAAKQARECGVRLALEPMRAGLGSSLVNSPDEAIALLDEVGARDAGIAFDTWHLWDLPDIAAQIERNGPRIFNVQISDYRPPRTFADRFLPGDGQIDWSDLLANLIRVGYQGYFDLEVFSDDGRWGVELPDALYKSDIAEWTGRGRKQFFELYTDAVRAVRSA